MCGRARRAFLWKFYVRCAIIAGTDAAASAEEDGDPVFKLIRALAFVLWQAVSAHVPYIDLDPRFTVDAPGE